MNDVYARCQTSGETRDKKIQRGKGSLKKETTAGCLAKSESHRKVDECIFTEEHQVPRGWN